MDLQETVAQIIHEELGEYVADLRFAGPYEEEDLDVVITLKSEPEDFEARERDVRRRLRQSGSDVGVFVEFPEEMLPV